MCRHVLKVYFRGAAMQTGWGRKVQLGKWTDLGSDRMKRAKDREEEEITPQF